jgi:hypothetical protein
MAPANRFRVRKGRSIYSHVWFVYRGESKYPIAMKRSLDSAMDLICGKLARRYAGQ